MLFIENKYTRWYYQIITNAQKQNRKKLKRDHPDYIHYENHHIIPECFFVNRVRKGPPGWLLDNPNEKENLVLLTAQEHFICHWLLTKMTNSVAKMKSIYALRSMRARRVTNGYETKITARVYDHIREEFSKNHSTAMRKPRAPGTGANISAGKIGKKHGPYSKEWCQNISIATKGVPKAKAICPYCSQIGGSGHMKRWHFDNCKKNPYKNPITRTSKSKGITLTKEICPHCEFIGAGGSMKRWHFDNCTQKL
jgi:hypothetical protein